MKGKFAYLLMGLLGSLGLVTAFALPAAASPALVHAPLAGHPHVVISPSSYSENLAGYAGIDNGLAAFNDVRGNAVVPDEPASVAPDSVAVGIVLQEYSNIASPTVGLGLVWDDNVHTGTCTDGGAQSDQWTLEWGAQHDGAPGVPLPPSELSPITDGSDIICVSPGTKYYLEIHDSTLFNVVTFVAGNLEPGNPVGTCPLTIFGPGVRFYNFGVGVDTSDGTTASSLQPGTLAAFTRDGLTQLLNPHSNKGGTNDRLTLNAFNLQEYIGTQDGTSSGAVTLQPTGLSTGSAFSVNVVS